MSRVYCAAVVLCGVLASFGFQPSGGPPSPWQIVSEVMTNPAPPPPTFKTMDLTFTTPLNTSAVYRLYEWATPPSPTPAQWYFRKNYTLPASGTQTTRTVTLVPPTNFTNSPALCIGNLFDNPMTTNQHTGVQYSWNWTNP